MAVLDEAEPPLKNRRELTRHDVRSADGVYICKDAFLSRKERLIPAEKPISCVPVPQHSEQEVDIVPRFILRDDPGHASRARFAVGQRRRIWLVPEGVVAVQQLFEPLTRFRFQGTGFRSGHTSRHDWHQQIPANHSCGQNSTSPTDYHASRPLSARWRPPSPAHVTGVSPANHFRRPACPPLRKPSSWLQALP